MGSQNCNSGVTDSGGTQNSVPVEENAQEINGKRREVQAGLHKLLTKNLDWRINLFCTFSWVIEHTSSVTRERYGFPGPEVVQFQHCSSFLSATQQLFSNFTTEFTQSSAWVPNRMTLKGSQPFLPLFLSQLPCWSLPFQLIRNLSHRELLPSLLSPFTTKLNRKSIPCFLYFHCDSLLNTMQSSCCFN